MMFAVTVTIILGACAIWFVEEAVTHLLEFLFPSIVHWAVRSVVGLAFKIAIPLSVVLSGAWYGQRYGLIPTFTYTAVQFGVWYELHPEQINWVSYFALSIFAACGALGALGESAEK
jgi:hypothetical protein